jgi:hypothetical protein
LKGERKGISGRLQCRARWRPWPAAKTSPAFAVLAIPGTVDDGTSTKRKEESVADSPRRFAGAEIGQGRCTASPSGRFPSLSGGGLVAVASALSEGVARDWGGVGRDGAAEAAI